VLAAFALAVGLAASQTPGRAPQATFRSGVSSVQVDAYVADAAGEPVAGLTANDFELIDAGSPQAINWLDVPDFSLPTLAMSGLTLTSTSAADAPTIGAKDPRLPSPPTAARVIGKGGAVVVAGEPTRADSARLAPSPSRGNCGKASA
jgi:hypothetical protein